VLGLHIWPRGSLEVAGRLNQAGRIPAIMFIRTCMSFSFPHLCGQVLARRRDSRGLFARGIRVEFKDRDGAVGPAMATVRS
jgi:hypothetical protein